MAGNINHEMMYFPHAPGAPPPPVVNPPVVPQAVVPQAVVQQPVGQEPQPAQQPVENDDNIAGAPPPHQQQEPLFIGLHNLVGPRLPPIDDIVANDPEIRRICSEISTFLSTNANVFYVTEYAQAISRASVNNNNLICDYSQTCGVKDDYLRGSCRLLVGTLSGNDSEFRTYYLNPTRIDDKYMTILYPNDPHPHNTIFSIINTGGFNGVVFSTKPPNACIWSGDNNKINRLFITINDDPTNIITVGVPGTVIGGHGGDEARAVSYYIPIDKLGSTYYIQSESKEGGKSKTKLYIYLTMETDDSGWRENQSNSKECCYPQGSC
jgi:hypothetical protein